MRQRVCMCPLQQRQGSFLLRRQAQWWASCSGGVEPSLPSQGPRTHMPPLELHTKGGGHHCGHAPSNQPRTHRWCTARTITMTHRRERRRSRVVSRPDHNQARQQATVGRGAGRNPVAHPHHANIHGHMRSRPKREERSLNRKQSITHNGQGQHTHPHTQTHTPHTHARAHTQSW